MRQQSKHGVRGILGLLMNTEQPLYGPHHHMNMELLNMAFMMSMKFTKICVFLKGQCIHLSDAVKVKACQAAKMTKSTKNEYISSTLKKLCVRKRRKSNSISIDNILSNLIQCHTSFLSIMQQLQHSKLNLRIFRCIQPRK